MLKTVELIRGVGRFTELKTPTADECQFRKSTLIFAPNGTGKSTLAAVLRAAGTHDVSAIRLREAVAAPGNQVVRLKHMDGTTTSYAGKWRGPKFGIYVFDRDFVEANVHVGRRVGKLQRAGLLGVAIGEAEVAAKIELDAINTELKEIAKRRRTVAAAASAVAQTFNIGLREFRTLPSATTSEVAHADRSVSLAVRSRDILERAEMAPLPTLPDDISLENLRAVLAGEPQRAVHVASANLGALGSDVLSEPRLSWARLGLQLAHPDACPFCRQSVPPFIISAYKELFSVALDGLLHKVTTARAAPEALRGWWTQVLRAGQANGLALRQWKDLLTDPPLLGSKEVKDRFFHAVSALEAAVESRSAAPVTPFSMTREESDALLAVRETAAAVELYNEKLPVAITEIRSHKASVREMPPLAASRQLLQRRQAARRRDEPDVQVLLGDLDALDSRRKELERQKADLRHSFDGNVGLTLTGFCQRGRPGATYAIRICNTPIPADASERFATLLSEGDRNALAFAFFVAATAGRAQADSITVLDDPVSSLDRDRTYSTIEIINKLASGPGQLIIFSHDPAFLYGCSERLPREDVRELRLQRNGAHIAPWSSKEQCENRWHACRNSMRRFVDSSSYDEQESLNQRANIRILLEDYLRLRWPERFPSHLTLERYVEILRTETRDILYSSEDVTELQSLCKFSQGQHHGQELSPVATPSPMEVRARCQRALDWLDK